MIGKVCRRGTDTRRLLGYLFTEGLAGERGLDSPHVDARVIAGFQPPDGLEPQRRPDGRADVSRLAALLDAPVRAGGVGKEAKATYHLAISAAPGDRRLSDDEWADVAAEHLERIGLAPRPGSGTEEGVRWVAVRHAPDHIHVVATLVSQQGRRIWPRNDFYRAREASLAVEARYGLTATSPADRTGDRETTRAEQRRHVDETHRRTARGLPPRPAPDRVVLRSKVRAALAGAGSFAELSERLHRDGVLVKPRMSVQDPDEITGYAVALRPSGAGAGAEPLWFGGGKLAPDLTFPQLQARWSGEPAPTPGWPPTSEVGADLSLLERRRLWLAAERAISNAEEQLRAAGSGDSNATAAAEAAAVAASEVLAAVGRLTERYGHGPLRQAADTYDRAARGLRRRAPVPTVSARHTRRAAGGLLGMQFVRQADTRQLLMVLDQLSRLSAMLGGMREQQGRAAQAIAARRTAELLVAERTRRATAASAAITGRKRAAVPTLAQGPVGIVLSGAHWQRPPVTPPRGTSR